MAVGTCPTVRSCSVSLPIAVTVCKSPSAEPVDVWTTQARCPQAHRRSNNNRPEQNEKCVTHVAGQNCYPCPRLHTAVLAAIQCKTTQVAPTTQTTKYPSWIA